VHARTWGFLVPEGGVAIQVLGEFSLTVGRRSVPVGHTCRCLLALMALKDGQVSRARIAGMLWPEARSGRASANLRSALWRLQQSCAGVVDVSLYDLHLAPHVWVDIRDTIGVATKLLEPESAWRPDDRAVALCGDLYQDIAPDIGDGEWIDAERERYRQLRLHALEALSSRFLRAGWHGAAVDAALGAIRADPFRESAHRLLVLAHLAEGNRLEASRCQHAYHTLLTSELGLAPSGEFMRLLQSDNGPFAQAQVR